MSEVKVTWLVNGVEREGNTFTNVMPRTTIQRELTVTSSGVVSIPNVPILPIEPQLTPLDAVDRLMALHNEHTSLRKAFDALRARLKEKE